MRGPIVIAASVAVIASVSAFGEEPKLAPEGRGLLPRPSPTTPEGPTPAHSFLRDPSGGFSRTIYETDVNPDFKITIRDFSFPPDKETHTVTLASGAFIHLLGAHGDISVANKRLELAPMSRTAVPAGASIQVVNNGEYSVVVRALILEAK
jgi:hypothetical protein